MSGKRLVTVSKYLSKYLRHAPEEIGLTLEPGGWAGIDDLLAAGKHGFAIRRDELEQVVAESDKQRFAIDPTGSKIKANQGHSTDVELTFDAVPPPAELFHGTADRNRDAILRDGLVKMKRHHVHLSADVPTAIQVGQRHGKPVVFVVDAAGMAAAGVTFYRSDNGVWLTDHVPPQYLREREQLA
jgi:putative RNA 2'-phosphotransferase